MENQELIGLMELYIRSSYVIANGNDPDLQDFRLMFSICHHWAALGKVASWNSWLKISGYEVKKETGFIWPDGW